MLYKIVKEIFKKKKKKNRNEKPDFRNIQCIILNLIFQHMFNCHLDLFY